MEIHKVCEHCKKDFVAQKVATRYCSHKCNQRAYKARKREEKIKAVNEQTQKKKTKPIEELQAKDFLTAREVAALLGISVRSVYYQIESGQIKAVNLGERMTRVKRTDIDKLFEQPPTPKPETQTKDIEIADCYTYAEIYEKYNVSESALLKIIKRYEIPRIKKGWFVYAPKAEIDKVFQGTG